MDVVKGVAVGVGGGRVGVGVGVEDDMGDGMQCSDHPYRNNPGGICAFCLQEKLGKLVSSSFPLPIRVSSSSSSSPSFRSDNIGSSNSVSNVVGAGSSLSLAVRPTSRNDNGGSSLSSHYQEYYSSRRAKIPLLLAKKKKIMVASSSTSSSASDHRDIVFKRSKSTAAPRTRRTHFLDNDGDQDFSPRKRNGFWSFLYHSSKPNPAKKTLTINPTVTTTTVTNGSRCVGSDIHVVLEEDDSPNSQATASAASSFERKVSRSRSVGCGSRSFSGDFFERISTGFGDCTLRRVESQREGKQKVTTTTTAHHHHMKEKVKCGGIFGGFVITSSSSSSSSSSYWVSSSAEEMNGKPPTGSLSHGRTKSWGWAFASPMRAFAPKPSSKDGKRDLNKKTTPDLTAIPSLLAVRG